MDALTRFGMDASQHDMEILIWGAFLSRGTGFAGFVPEGKSMICDIWPTS